MIDDAVVRVRKLLQDNGYSLAEIDKLLGANNVNPRDELAKNAMRELVKAQCEGKVMVNLDVEEITRQAYAQADSMLMFRALLH